MARLTTLLSGIREARKLKTEFHVAPYAVVIEQNT